MKYHPEALPGEVVNRMHATLLSFRLPAHAYYLKRELTAEAQERAEKLRLRHMLGDADVLKPWFLHCHEGHETAYGMLEGEFDFGGGTAVATWVRDVLAQHDPAMVLMMRKGADQHAERTRDDLNPFTIFPYGLAYPQDVERGARLAARRLGVSLESLDSDSLAQLGRSSEQLWDDAEARVAFKIDYGTIVQKLEQEGRIRRSEPDLPEEDEDDLDLLDEWDEYVEPGYPEVVNLVSWAGMSSINRQYERPRSRFEYPIDSFAVDQLNDVLDACDVLHYAALGDRSSVRRSGQAQALILKKLADQRAVFTAYFTYPLSAPTAYVLGQTLTAAGMTERVRSAMPALTDKMEALAQSYGDWARKHSPEWLQEPKTSLSPSSPNLSWAVRRFGVDPERFRPEQYWDELDRLHRQAWNDLELELALRRDQRVVDESLRFIAKGQSSDPASRRANAPLMEQPYVRFQAECRPLAGPGDRPRAERRFRALGTRRQQTLALRRPRQPSTLSVLLRTRCGPSQRPSHPSRPQEHDKRLVRGMSVRWAPWGSNPQPAD